ncbi:MAG: acyltransferase [Muribaculaceae bacterium]|nr:acyltransferase [Muribaculaceae bacterium]
MKSKFLLLWSWLIRSLLFFFPDVPQISRFRGWLYGLGMKRCGSNLIVQHDAILRNLENLEFGSNIRIANHVTIWGAYPIEIGDCVIIGPHTTIVSGNHTFGNGSFRNGKGTGGKVTIGANSWIAANSTVAAKSVLPECSVLGANSMLNKAFDVPYGIYGGVPAKFIKCFDH